MRRAVPLLARPLLACLALAACGGANQRLDAAADVRAFLVAVRERDRAAFDAHVDRPALRTNVQAQLRARAADDPLTGLLLTAEGAQLIERLIAPETFRFAVQAAGPLAERTPSTAELAALLRPLGETRVCIPRDGGEGTCAATFERQGDVWRLVAIDTGDLGVQVLQGSAAG